MDNFEMEIPTVAEKPKSSSRKVLELALAMFEFCTTSTGEPVAIKKSGSNIALAFQGRGLTLRNVLAELILKHQGWILSDKAFKEASYILQAEAARNPKTSPSGLARMMAIGSSTWVPIPKKLSR